MGNAIFLAVIILAGCVGLAHIIAPVKHPIVLVLEMVGRIPRPPTAAECQQAAADQAAKAMFVLWRE